MEYLDNLIKTPKKTNIKKLPIIEETQTLPVWVGVIYNVFLLWYNHLLYYNAYYNMVIITKKERINNTIIAKAMTFTRNL